MISSQSFPQNNFGHLLQKYSALTHNIVQYIIIVNKYSWYFEMQIYNIQEVCKIITLYAHSLHIGAIYLLAFHSGTFFQFFFLPE